jgi:hypothetical protein
LNTAEGEIDQLQTDVAKAQGDATQALADAKQANDAIAGFGDIVTHNVAEFEVAGAAAAAEGRINATLANYSTTEQVEGKINTALASVLKFKGVKATQAELPTEGMVEGDVYFVTEASKEFVYANGKWEELGGVVDYDGLFESYLAPVKADIKTNSDNIQAIIDRMAWVYDVMP